MKQTILQRRHMEYQLQKHRVRGWRAVSTAMAMAMVTSVLTRPHCMNKFYSLRWSKVFAPPSYLLFREADSEPRWSRRAADQTNIIIHTTMITITITITVTVTITITITITVTITIITITITITTTIITITITITVTITIAINMNPTTLC